MSQALRSEFVNLNFVSKTPFDHPSSQCDMIEWQLSPQSQWRCLAHGENVDVDYCRWCCSHHHKVMRRCCLERETALMSWNFSRVSFLINKFKGKNTWRTSRGNGNWIRVFFHFEYKNKILIKHSLNSHFIWDEADNVPSNLRTKSLWRNPDLETRRRKNF